MTRPLCTLLFSLLTLEFTGCAGYNAIGVEQRGASFSLRRAGEPLADDEMPLVDAVVAETNRSLSDLRSTTERDRLVAEAIEKVRGRVRRRVLVKDQERGLASLEDLVMNRIILEHHDTLKPDNDTLLSASVSYVDWQENWLGGHTRPTELHEDGELYLRFDVQAIAWPRKEGYAPSPDVVLPQSSVEYYTESKLGRDVARSLALVLRAKVEERMKQAAAAHGLEVRRNSTEEDET